MTFIRASFHLVQYVAYNKTKEDVGTFVAENLYRRESRNVWHLGII